jgi:hypothetical protein
MARMLEDAKVEGFLVRLNAPGDGMARFDIDPTNKIRLGEKKGPILWSACHNPGNDGRHIPPYLAVDLQLLHGRHDCAKVGDKAKSMITRPQGELEWGSRKKARQVILCCVAKTKGENNRWPQCARQQALTGMYVGTSNPHH